MVFKIVAISGSLSKTSANSGLIRACILVNNPDVQIEVADISGFPLFNMDTVIQEDYPASVKIVREKVALADAVIFASPQHNYKISAALKNAYDWLSFTHDLTFKPPITQKPASFICCSLQGDTKAQQHFTRVCQYCKVKLMGKGLLVSKKATDFDQNVNAFGIIISKNLRLLSKIIKKMMQYDIQYDIYPQKLLQKPKNKQSQKTLKYLSKYIIFLSLIIHQTFNKQFKMIYIYKQLLQNQFLQYYKSVNKQQFITQIMDFDSRIAQSKQYMSTALRENYNSNNISKSLTSSSQILDELRKKYDTPTRRQLKQLQTKPIYDKPHIMQQSQSRRTINMLNFGQNLGRETNRRGTDQVGKYQMSPLYKKQNLAGEEETIFKKIKQMKDSLLNKNDKIKTTKSIYQPRYPERPQNRIIPDNRVENIDKINSKIQQILSCLKQTEKKSTLVDSQFKNISKVTADNSQKNYNPNKSIGFQQRPTSSFYQQNKNILENKVQVKNTSSIYQQKKQCKIASPAPKTVQGFELHSNRVQGSKVRSFINSIQKQTQGHFNNKYQMKSGKKLDDEIHKIQSKIQQFQQQKRKLNIQFKPYSYSNSKSTTNLSKRSYTIDKNVKPLSRNQISNNPGQAVRRFDDDSYSRKYGAYQRYGQINYSSKYPTRASFQPKSSITKNIQVAPINVQFQKKPEVVQKTQKTQNNSVASSLFHIKLIPVEGQQKSNCSSRVENRLFNEDLRRKADEGILDRKRKLSSQNTNNRSKTFIKKLVQKLSQQVTLDQQFRNNKLYFESNLQGNKWDQLQSQLKKKGIILGKQKLQKIFKVTDQQNNPFFSVRESQSSISSLIKSYCQCQQHWKTQMVKKFLKQDLLNDEFNAVMLDLEKKGYIVLEDIVRFLNMETGTFYRNRDIYLIFRRISQQQKMAFEQLIETFCK